MLEDEIKQSFKNKKKIGDHAKEKQKTGHLYPKSPKIAKYQI